MFKGLRTVIYHVHNINQAKEWYSSILGVKPYFDEPYYVGFNIGGFELGLDPDIKTTKIGNNSVAYWGVDNIEMIFKRLIDMGAKKNSEIQDVGDSIKVASVKDPYGNIIGLIENPHFKLG
jgi:predicted enzyme related to lactoylglutathione lyase